MATRTVEQTIRAAFERARGRTAAVHFVNTTPAGYAVYSVDSSASTDVAYSVTVSPTGLLTCTCPAADNGRGACWHRAAVLTVRASRQGFGLPVDGPSAEDDRAAAAVASREQAKRNLQRLEEMFAA